MLIHDIYLFQYYIKMHAIDIKMNAIYILMQTANIKM